MFHNEHITLYLMSKYVLIASASLFSNCRTNKLKKNYLSYHISKFYNLYLSKVTSTQYISKTKKI